MCRQRVSNTHCLGIALSLLREVNAVKRVDGLKEAIENIIFCESVGNLNLLLLNIYGLVYRPKHITTLGTSGWKARPIDMIYWSFLSLKESTNHYRSCNTISLEDKFYDLEYDTMKTSIFANWLHAPHHNVHMVLLAITFQFRLNQQPSNPHDLGSPAEFRQLFPRPQSYRDSTISTSWIFEIQIQYPLQ